MEICVIIPSHINNIKRAKLLISCLESLLNQTILIPIYLSMSFETDLDKKLFIKLNEKDNLINNKLIYFIYQEIKTSQFRHIEYVINQVKNKYKYIMFCDDDDKYEKNRVEKFINMIDYGESVYPKDKIFVGAYERDLLKGTHTSSFYEYWSYCVNIKYIINFFDTIKINNYDNVIDNKMCDVLFATYLRRLDNKHVFSSINEKLYIYNENDNEYSITQKILKKNDESKKNNLIKEYNNFELYIHELNKFLKNSMETIKNNIFITCATCDISFEQFLKTYLLKENYKYKNNINKKILEEIKFEYDKIENLCNILYQYKLTRLS